MITIYINKKKQVRLLDLWTVGGRKIWTYDPFRVREALVPWAKRLNMRLPDAARIYYGETAPLATVKLNFLEICKELSCQCIDGYLNTGNIKWMTTLFVTPSSQPSIIKNR